MSTLVVVDTSIQVRLPDFKVTSADAYRGAPAQQPGMDTAGGVCSAPPHKEPAATGFKQRDQVTFNPDFRLTGTAGGGGQPSRVSSLPEAMTRSALMIWPVPSNELMAPSEAQLKGVVEESKTLTAIASSSMTRSLLLLEWLKQSVALATTNRDAAAKALLDLAAEKPDNIASRVANYFEVGDYRAGVALFHSGTVPFTDGDRLGSRRTMWRADALKTWGEPRTKLANDLRGATPEQNRLVDLWTAAMVARGGDLRRSNREYRNRRLDDPFHL